MSNAKSRDGIIVVYKPADITSFNVVKKIKRWMMADKVGHGGTLDPFAEGVLVILVDRATRIADQFLEGDKAYRFVLRLDVETDTLDRTGRVVRIYDGSPVPAEFIGEVFERFKGEIDQKVPAFAATKVKGERLYKLARRGVDVERPYKRVSIHRLVVNHYEWPRVEIEVECSKGMYVRQLGADIANALGCCGHIERLVRLRNGLFTLEDAWPLDEVEEAVSSGEPEKVLIPMVDALEHLPEAIMDEEYLVKGLRHGRIDQEWAVRWRREVEEDRPVRIVDTKRSRVLALWWPSGRYRRKDSLRVLF